MLQTVEVVRAAGREATHQCEAARTQHAPGFSERTGGFGPEMYNAERKDPIEAGVRE